MIDTIQFGHELKKLGYRFFTGVPCSFLKDLINFAINECEYIAAVNEGEAVATAAGAFIGGQKAVVLMQNSGLGNAVSPLTSLNFPFKIPVLGFISLRGEVGIRDEPQHELMGLITEDLLSTIKIRWEYLSCDLKEAKIQLSKANQYIENNESFFFIVKKDTFEQVDLNSQEEISRKNGTKKCKHKEAELPSRYKTLEVINALKDQKTIQLATTGKTGRELYEIEDTATNFYMVGSMGCVNALGLGLALSKKDKDIIVVDGDGAALMHLGSLTVNGLYHPPNMLHILLDNGSYDSTGGQKTVSANVDFVDIAVGCGYSHGIYAHDLKELAYYITEWKKTKGLTFIHFEIAKGSKKELGRPKLKPYEILARMKVSIHD